MRKEPVRAPLLRIAKTLAALFLTAALFQPGPTRAGSHGTEGHGSGGGHGGEGFHGGGFPGGAGGFHGGAFRGAPGGFHGGFAGFPHGRFHGGEFHPHGFPHGEFHGERFHHHGFHGGVVLAPAFGGLWWGGALGWPYYSYPYESYYGQGPYTQYWYCEDPPGFYPSVTQCNTGWQMVPAN